MDYEELDTLGFNVKDKDITLLFYLKSQKVWKKTKDLLEFQTVGMEIEFMGFLVLVYGKLRIAEHFRWGL